MAGCSLDSPQPLPKKQETSKDSSAKKTNLPKTKSSEPSQDSKENVTSVSDSKNKKPEAMIPNQDSTSTVPATTKAEPTNSVNAKPDAKKSEIKSDEKPVKSVVNKLDPNFFYNLVKYDDVKTLKSFIEANETSGLDVRDPLRRTPLHYSKSAKMAEILWERNLPVGIRNKKGKIKKIPRAAYKIKDVNGTLPMHMIAESPDSHAISVVLEKLCNADDSVFLNSPDSKGNSILHLGVKSKNINTIHNILNCNWVNTESLNNKKQTALHLAVEQQDFALGYILLLKRGLVNLKVKDSNKETPLAKAYRLGNCNAIEILTFYGAPTPLKYKNFDFKNSCR